MKTMKTLSRRMAALFLVVVVGLTALAPAASAAAIQLPSLPKDKCVVDDAGVLSDSTTTELETINAQLSASCNGAQIGVLTVDYTGSATNVANTIAEVYGVSLNGVTISPDGSAVPNPSHPAHASLGNIIGGLFELLAYIIVTIALFFVFITPLGHSFGWYWGPFGWFGARRRRGPRPPRGPYDDFGPGGGFYGGSRGPRGPRGPRPPRGGGFGGFGGMGGGSGFGGAGRSGGSFGGMGGGSSHGGGAGRGR